MKKLKALLINGSPRAKGCTYTALTELKNTLEQEGMEVELIYVGHKDVHGCIACRKCKEIGKCVFDDIVNEVAPKFNEADAFVIGAPVYYASPAGGAIAFLDRLFFSTANVDKTMKVGAAVMKKGVPTATDADRKLHKQVATLNKIIPSFNNGKMIKITDKCIGCKVCEKVCPTGNIIVLTNYAQRRSKKCEYCLACVHACPQKAIIIKHEKNKNERYRNENVSLDEIIKSNFQDRRESYE